MSQAPVVSEKVIFHEICFKKNRKIVFFFSKNLRSYKNQNDEPLLSFRLWHSQPGLKNIYKKVETLEEIEEHLKSLLCKKGQALKDRIKSDQIEEPMKIVYNFSRLLCSQDKTIKENFFEFFYSASKIQFHGCSSNFIKCFFGKSDGQSQLQRPDNIQQILSFKNCKLDDFDFKKKVLEQLPQPENEDQNINIGNDNNQLKISESYSFEKFQFYFEQCPHITDSTLKELGLWKANLLSSLSPSMNDLIKKLKDNGCGLSLKSQPSMTSKQVLNLASQPFFKMLKTLKMKNMTQFKGTDIIKEMLSYRQEIQTDELIQIKTLKVLSFDKTVCTRFDDVGINLNFKNLSKLSYTGSINGEPKDVILFSNILSSSFLNLHKLKLKSCILTKEFFSCFASLPMCRELETINFKNSVLDLEGFKSFITRGQLLKLEKLNLQGTNIDDEVCSLIATQTSIGDTGNFLTAYCSLKYMDISSIQNKDFSQKGIKFMFQSYRLSQINIENNDCVDDSLADFIVHLARRRQQNLQKKKDKQAISQQNQDQKEGSNVSSFIPLEKNFEITQLSLRGCQNITSAFFMILQAENLLKNVEQLNVSGTSVCNNFIDLLITEKQQVSERQPGQMMPLGPGASPARNPLSFATGNQNSRSSNNSQTKQSRNSANSPFSSLKAENSALSSSRNSSSLEMKSKLLSSSLQSLQVLKQSQAAPSSQQSEKENEKDSPKNVLKFQQLSSKIKEEKEESEDEDSHEEDGEEEEMVNNQPQIPQEQQLEDNNLLNLSSARSSGRNNIQEEEEKAPSVGNSSSKSKKIKNEFPTTGIEGIGQAVEIPNLTMSNWKQEKKEKKNKIERFDSQEEFAGINDHPSSSEGDSDEEDSHSEEEDSHSEEEDSHSDQKDNESLKEARERNRRNKNSDDVESLEPSQHSLDSERSSTKANKPIVSSTNKLSQKNQNLNDSNEMELHQSSSQESLKDQKKNQIDQDSDKEEHKSQESKHHKSEPEIQYDNFYTQAFIPMYGQLPLKKLKKQKKIAIKIAKNVSNFFEYASRKISEKFQRSFRGLKGSLQHEPVVEQEKEEVIIHEVQKSELISKLQFLSIAGCQHITSDKILQFLLQANSKVSSTLCILDISGTNIISPEHTKVPLFSDSMQQEKRNKGLLQMILEHMTSLLKLNISNTQITRDCFKTDEKFSLNEIQLIKLKANGTNFDFSFFCDKNVGNLHELQLQNCTHITKQNLHDFIENLHDFIKNQKRIQQDNPPSTDMVNPIKPINQGQAFDIFKTICYFQNMVTDDLLLQIIQTYPFACAQPQINLSNCGLLELNYTKSDMDNFLNQLFSSKNCSTEVIDLSHTRVSPKFVRKFLQEVQKKDVTTLSLVLQDCPMIDGSIFQPSSGKKDSFNLLFQKSFKSHQLLQNVRHCLRDEDLVGLDLKRKLSGLTNYALIQISLEGNQLISNSGFICLFGSQFMKRIESLNLSYTLLNDRAVKFLRNQTKSKDKANFQKLVSLQIKGCPELTKKSLLDLCEIEGFHANFNIECIFDLQHLLDMEVFKAASNSLYFQNVQTINLSYYPRNNIDEVISQLCLKGRDIELKVQTIHLSSTRISDSGLQFISVSKNLKKLQRIYLSRCSNLFDKGFSYLLESQNLAQLDAQHLLSQAGHVAMRRVFDTFNFSQLSLQINELNFADTRLTMMDIEGIIQNIKQLSGLRLIRFISSSNFDETNVKQILESLTLTKVVYVLFPSHWTGNQTKSIGASQNIEFEYNPTENEAKLVEMLQKALGKKYSSDLTSNLQKIAQIVNIKPESLEQQIPSYGFYPKFQTASVSTNQMSISISHFVRANPNIINDLYLDSLLILRKTRSDYPGLILAQLDFTGIKSISDECLVRFFYFQQFQLIHVDISGTLASENVIFALLSNQTLEKTLKTILFDNCTNLNYPKALLAILVKKNVVKEESALQKTRILFRYKKYFDDKFLAIYFDLLNKQLHLTSIYSAPMKKFFKISVPPKSLIKLNIPKILDLEGSQITLKNVHLKLFHLKKFTIINLSRTPVDIDSLKSFCRNNKEAFKQELRYLWINDTYNLNDWDLADHGFFDSIGFNNLNYNEFLYSKGDCARYMLDSFAQRSKNSSYVKLQHTIQFEYFPLITFNIAKNLLTSQTESTRIASISLSFNQQNVNCLEQIGTSPEFINYKGIKSIFVKQSPKGNLKWGSEESSTLVPACFCISSVNPYLGQQFNLNPFLNFANTMFLTELDFKGSIISGSQLYILFASINPKNSIRRIDISDHITVNDLTIMVTGQTALKQDFNYILLLRKCGI